MEITILFSLRVTDLWILYLIPCMCDEKKWTATATKLATYVDDISINMPIAFIACPVIVRWLEIKISERGSLRKAMDKYYVIMTSLFISSLRSILCSNLLNDACIHTAQDTYTYTHACVQLPQQHKNKYFEASESSEIYSVYAKRLW